jgi:hypothetical protein
VVDCSIRTEDEGMARERSFRDSEVGMEPLRVDVPRSRELSTIEVTNVTSPVACDGRPVVEVATGPEESGTRIPDESAWVELALPEGNTAENVPDGTMSTAEEESVVEPLVLRAEEVMGLSSDIPVVMDDWGILVISVLCCNVPDSRRVSLERDWLSAMGIGWDEVDMAADTVTWLSNLEPSSDVTGVLCISATVVLEMYSTEERSVICGGEACSVVRLDGPWESGVVWSERIPELGVKRLSLCVDDCVEMMVEVAAESTLWEDAWCCEEAGLIGPESNLEEDVSCVEVGDGCDIIGVVNCSWLVDFDCCITDL